MSQTESEPQTRTGQDPSGDDTEEGLPPGGEDPGGPTGGPEGGPIDEPCDDDELTGGSLPPLGIDTGWYLDIEEEDGTEYSIPLSRIYPGLETSVSTFVSSINDDITDFYSLYPELEPRLNLKVDAAKFGAGVAHGHTSRELLIRYRIRQLAANPANPNAPKFKINFISGPHGSNVFDFLGYNLGLTDPNEEDPESDLYITTDITSRPRLQIGDIPFSLGNAITISDYPPVPPVVDIYPFRNVDDRILFLINGTSGDEEVVPIEIETSDIEVFRNSYIAQGMPGALPNVTMATVDAHVFSNPIRFKNDDPTYVYQVFRTTTPPESYADFQDNMIATAFENISNNPETPAVLVSYLDNIDSNTKYYYCFRAIDVHGNISNPTIIYQIEMVDNNGQIYPIIEEYNFPSTTTTKFFKTGRRYIFIEPTYRQTYLNTRTEGPALNPNLPAQLEVGTSPGNNILGSHGTDVAWDKIFKVRITSKKTGRKVDLNLIMKNTGLDNP